MAIVGKNILDNLTTGMYKDSKVIYREYVQNACDQIDIAFEDKLTIEEEAFVDIFIDEVKRYISIRDNATGVSSKSFREELGDIANSSKERGKHKGFRGIGRLCGIGYCKELKFITSYKGEKVKSTMVCNAEKIRKMLMEKTKYTLDEVWDTNVTFYEEEENVDAHYFEVQLMDIKRESKDLLNIRNIKDYLSFVAPVPYKNKFIFRNDIYAHAKKNNHKIDEYKIMVNGAQIFKEYATRLKEKSGAGEKNYDEISKLKFYDIKDKNGILLAWMWVGLSRFEKQIPSLNSMRGIRLRSHNIQIGDDSSLSHLFKESRGNYYFVGEVFAVDENLIPNSQRDYFNENETREAFEFALRDYFYTVLHKLYNAANKIKNAYKRQVEYVEKVKELKQKTEKGYFISEEDKQKMQLSVEHARTEAEKAISQLYKYEDLNESSPLAEVHKRIGEKYDAKNLGLKVVKTEIPKEEEIPRKKIYITSDMSTLSRNERKLVSKILIIIADVAPKEIAEEVIKRIREEIK